MKSISLLSFAAVIGISSLGLAQTWSLEYGSAKNQLSYFNSKNTPDFAEDSPYGPMSFRVVGDRLWVLDSIAGKLSCFDKNSKLVNSVEVPNLQGFKLLEDFAIAFDSSNRPEYVWIANAADLLIKKISVKDGKVVATIGGSGSEQGKFLQVNQLEVDAIGRLYVADIAKSLVSVFSSNGSFIREQSWQSSGMVIDKAENLHLLYYSDKSGYSHQVYNVSGQLVRSTHLGLNDNTNARIVEANLDGSIIISLVPAGGFKGVMSLYKIGASGVITEKLEFVPAMVMNRGLYIAEDKVFIAETDFEAAPSAKFVIKPLKWEEKKSEGHKK